jgi:hypothetical protein
MPSSYYRNCKTCGRRIQLRQMPAGQWVAYEGYDTVHDCSRRPSQHASAPHPRGPQSSGQLEGPSYDGLEFVDIEVPGSPNPDNTPGRGSHSATPISPTRAHSPFQRKPKHVVGTALPSASRPGAPRPGRPRIPAWVWVATGIALLVLLRSCAG